MHHKFSFTQSIEDVVLMCSAEYWSIRPSFIAASMRPANALASISVLNVNYTGLGSTPLRTKRTSQLPLFFC